MCYYFIDLNILVLLYSETLFRKIAGYPAK